MTARSARRRGSLNIDDEGTPTQCTTLIENGVLRGYMQDRLNARLMGAQPTGKRPARVLRAHDSAAHDQHLHAAPGRMHPRKSSARCRRGIYAVNFGGGQVDITSGKFVFSASEGVCHRETAAWGAPPEGRDPLIGKRS